MSNATIESATNRTAHNVRIEIGDYHRPVFQFTVNAGKWSVCRRVEVVDQKHHNHEGVQKIMRLICSSEADATSPFLPAGNITETEDGREFILAKWDTIDTEDTEFGDAEDVTFTIWCEDSGSIDAVIGCGAVPVINDGAGDKLIVFEFPSILPDGELAYAEPAPATA